MHSHQPGHATARLELAPDQMPRRLGGHHAHIHVFWWGDLTVMNIEAVCEHQRVARTEPCCDTRFVYGATVLIRHEHRDLPCSPDPTKRRLASTQRLPPHHSRKG